ncbi:Clusterin-associated protein 1 [Boothiomyces sp. JEL0866]|nr:Clusterin-associated protein 1 [Boothiomyces sp. JEL0866]
METEIQVYKRNSVVKTKYHIKKSIFHPTIDEDYSVPSVEPSISDLELMIDKKKSSVLHSTIDLCNTILGTGFVITLFAIAATWFSLRLLVFSAELAHGQQRPKPFILVTTDGEPSFSSIGQAILPKRLTILCDISVILGCLGFAVSYLISIGEGMPEIFQYIIHQDSILYPILTNRFFWMIAFLAVIVPLNYAKSVDDFWWFSGLALFCACYLAILIPYLAVFVKSKGDYELFVFDWSTFQSIPIFIFAFTCHQNIFSIYNLIDANYIQGHSLEPKQLIHIFSVIDLSVILVGVTYMSIDEAGVLILVGKFFYSLLAALSFPIQAHPCRLAMESLYNYFKDEMFIGYSEIPDDDNSSYSPLNLEEDVLLTRESRRMVLSTVILALSYATAFVIPNLDFYLAFVGATGGVFMCYVLPTLCYCQVTKNEEWGIKQIIGLILSGFAFTEQLKGLGYPQPVSMESFRTPNFDTMGNILHWLVNNYDPTFEISLDFSSESSRVQFVKSIAAYIAPKAQIRLNTRNLYKADGFAVRELMKISELLSKARTTGKEDDSIILPPLDISNKLGKLKSCRALASGITEKGAELFDLLGRELELRDVRTGVISKPFELMAMEKAVTEAINKLREKLNSTQNAFESLQADEYNLLAKIEKKKAELERAEKRLKSLQGVRPAYMDEYEKIEVDLVRVYNIYMEKFRNLTFLEQQLDEYHREEQDKFEETESSLKRMQNRLREEELELLRGENDGNKSARPNRPAAAGSRSRGLNKQQDSDSNEDEFEEDGVSLDSDMSSGEFVDEDLESGKIPEQQQRPSEAKRGRRPEKQEEEDEDEDESSIDIGDDGEDDLDDTDF